MLLRSVCPVTTSAANVATPDRHLCSISHHRDRVRLRKCTSIIPRRRNHYLGPEGRHTTSFSQCNARQRLRRLVFCLTSRSHNTRNASVVMRHSSSSTCIKKLQHPSKVLVYSHIGLPGTLIYEKVAARASLPQRGIGIFMRAMPRARFGVDKTRKPTVQMLPVPDTIGNGVVRIARTTV